MFPGEKDAGFSVDYVEFEVNVRDASEKLRIPLLALPCFECYALVILNCYSLFLTCTLLSCFQIFCLAVISDWNALPTFIFIILHTVKFILSRCIV